MNLGPSPCVITGVNSSKYCCVYAHLLSHFWFFGTPWTVARQASLSMGFSRQEYWSGLPFPPLGDLPSLGIKLTSPAFPALADGCFTTEPPGKSQASIKPLLSLSGGQIWRAAVHGVANIRHDSAAEQQQSPISPSLLRLNS